MKGIRGMMQETRLHPKDFIYPIFVAEGENLENPVASMPGVFQYSLDRLDGILKKVRGERHFRRSAIRHSRHKDEVGSQAYAPDGITSGR